MITVMTDDLLQYISAQILAEIAQRREDASHSGTIDPIADALELNLRLYNNGFVKSIPNSWEHFAIDYEKTLDPEWVEYLRLKAKFEA